MIAPLVEIALSNLVASLALACLAHGVDRSGRHPRVAHALWVLVLVKVLTPPLVMLPIVPGGAGPTFAVGASAAGNGSAAAAPIATLLAGLGEAMPVLLIGWAVGSVIVLAVSLVRVRRFDRLLGRTSAEVDADIRLLASGVSARLGLRSCPRILVTSARISPLTWWTGGRAKVFLPSALCRAIDMDALRWVLAHELGHVKRRDHLVRWLEWLACVAFWWNPVVWWARRSLRHDEEVSCDALVVERLDGRPQTYARALLSVVEFLASAATRPPAVATGIDAGGRLEQRFARIVAPPMARPTPRRLAAALLGAAIVLMTLGVGAATVVVPSASPLTSETWSARSEASARAEVAGGSRGLTAVPGSEAVDAAAASVARELGDAYAPISGEITDAGVGAGRMGGIERVGDRGPDHLVGSIGGDALAGRGGPDRLLGASGPDDIRGGRGDDMIFGGAGADRIDGGAGDDVIIGGRGADAIHGGRGDDRIRTWQDGTADSVDCGPGHGDRAVIDVADTTTGCEVVSRR